MRTVASLGYADHRGHTMSTIHEASVSYERWLGARLDIVRADLRYKHTRMRESAFVFLRGSFFYWAHRWKTWCPDLADAPTVVAVGDVHVENFGTWRDVEGRLAYGRICRRLPPRPRLR